MHNVTPRKLLLGTLLAGGLAVALRLLIYRDTLTVQSIALLLFCLAVGAGYVWWKRKPNA